MIRALAKWYRRQRLYRACPELRAFDKAIAEHRKKHKAVKPIEAKKRALILEALK